MPSISIWSANTWGEAEDLVARLSVLLDEVKASKPSVICCQELFTPFSRFSFDTKLKDDYFLFHAVCRFPRPPLISFLLPLALAVPTWWGLLVNPYSILLISNFLLRPFLFPGVPLVPGDRWSSFMGGCTCLSKGVFSTASIVAQQGFPHSIRGYPIPSLFQPGKLAFYYLQHTFFRPHYTLCEAFLKEGGRRVLTANVHLVLGKDNPYRAKQIGFVLEKISAFAREGDAVILCGDFNADIKNGDECFELLLREGYTDSAAWAEEGSKLNTWCITNKYVEVDEDLNSRIDYCFTLNHKSGVSHEVIFNTENNIISDHFAVAANVTF
mmetsp:Transcript_14347/g.29521  ORF Transcript_14347/g.29521 Transcript_14347/m.29521 type:complete len:326 (-) Transcript_14347:21-998(-)